MLEDLPELVSINVQQNSLESFVLEDLPELVSFDQCSQQQFVGVGVAFFAEADQLLTASYNQLTSVVLESDRNNSGFGDSTVLNNNQLVEVELDGFAELNHVNLRYSANV